MVNQWLYNWADAQIANPVIFRDQNGPQPVGPYVTLKAIAAPREEWAEVGEVNNLGVAEIKQSALITCSVQSFGSGIFGDIQTLRNSLEKITVQQALRLDGMAFVRVASEPVDVPEIVGTTFESRAIMDVIFRVPISVMDTVGLIESAQFTATAEGLSVTKLITQQGIS